MALDTGADSEADTPGPRLLARIREASTLDELATSLNADSHDEAYFRAKRLWSRRTVPTAGMRDGLPGARVTVDGVDVVVHGITHANTETEQAVVRGHTTAAENDGASVYCEQGIRSMYLEDFDSVCAMDDYRWAMDRCAHHDLDAPVADVPRSEFQGLLDSLGSVSDELREATFSLIESGSAIYGEQFSTALGDVASDFLTSEADLATGEDFEAFRRTRRAAADPANLDALQDYYRRVLLPQPLEREWLRRHDRELELLTHARNERMTDYVLHEADGPRAEVFVGAAHQPGLVYYLEQYRDGHRAVGDFEYLG
mgnify:CR=1 FL=1